MARQALRFRCYKCKEIFTIGANIEEGGNKTLVETIVPCLECGADNQITVTSDQLGLISVTRGEDSSQVSELPKGIFMGQVFEGQQPDDQGL